MAYYSAHYGSWNEPGGVKRVEFGEESGIRYLFSITDYKYAITKAREVANKTGKVVTFCKTIPTGSGLRKEYRDINPMV